MALAQGARGGLARIERPAVVNTASEEPVNWPGRFWIRNLAEAARCPAAIILLAAEYAVLRFAGRPAARAGAKGSRAARGATSPARGKDTRSRGSAAGSQVKKAAATPAGKSLDRAQHALDQAAKTEKQLRASLKKHSEAASAAKDDLAKRGRDLEAMKSQLKIAKKSRKRAARELSPGSQGWLRTSPGHATR
jgi:hypothetical protein